MVELGVRKWVFGEDWRTSCSILLELLGGASWKSPQPQLHQEAPGSFLRVLVFQSVATQDGTNCQPTIIARTAARTMYLN